uniref:Uncharacterized protein n=1 Tax=Anguilla anguilla TaxID=7936 RepID=A0A0E9URZ5_ANGAN
MCACNKASLFIECLLLSAQKHTHKQTAVSPFYVSAYQ